MKFSYVEPLIVKSQITSFSEHFACSVQLKCLAYNLFKATNLLLMN